MSVLYAYLMPPTVQHPDPSSEERDPDRLGVLDMRELMTSLPLRVYRDRFDHLDIIVHLSDRFPLLQILTAARKAIATDTRTGKPTQTLQLLNQAAMAIEPEVLMPPDVKRSNNDR